MDKELEAREAKEEEDRIFAQRVEYSLQQEVEEKIALDGALAERFEENLQRAEHRTSKRGFFDYKIKDAKDLYDSALKAWSSPAHDIEDVSGGICISVFLPDLSDVNIRLKPNRRSVLVDAKRSLFNDLGSRSPALKYATEFLIDIHGGMRIRDRDMSYEYTSEAGILFIYLEHQSLRRHHGSQSVP
uniref:Uncharacterized protein n=1 Tax=Octactis speculum TaxID=3111310 RepID=A0A6U3RLF3_9STRA|mmetsp:Transcript_25731/g.35401  ORF Transcript_25731/g.35401 Transcript_25731/m.35401 type:complete len:187 (+) Transcript_25731:237-797(+)